MGKNRELYKVKLSEREAHVIGERRWDNAFEARWYGSSLCVVVAFLAMLGLLFSPAIGVLPWVSIAGCSLIGSALLFRWFWSTRACIKAGKAYAQSLGGRPAELTEEEIDIVGCMRWVKENKKRERRFLLGTLGAIGVSLGAAIIATMLSISDWAVLGIFCIAIAPGFYLLFRWVRLKDKAGKAFVEELKKAGKGV